MKKLFLAIVLSLTGILIAGNSNTTFAETNASEYSEDYEKIYLSEIDKYIYVKKGIDVPREELIELARQTDKPVGVNFFQKNEADTPKKVTRGRRTHVIRDTTVRHTTKNTKVVASVAKGSTYTLNSSVTFSQNASIDSSVGAEFFSIAKAHLGASYSLNFTGKVQAGYSYSGPPESSPHRTRTYYSGIKTKFGYLKIKRVGQPNSAFKKVNYEVPMYLIGWYIDEN